MVYHNHDTVYVYMYFLCVYFLAVSFIYLFYTLADHLFNALVQLRIHISTSHIYSILSLWNLPCLFQIGLSDAITEHTFTPGLGNILPVKKNLDKFTEIVYVHNNNSDLGLCLPPSSNGFFELKLLQKRPSKGVPFPLTPRAPASPQSCPGICHPFQAASHVLREEPRVGHQVVLYGHIDQW